MVKTPQISSTEVAVTLQYDLTDIDKVTIAGATGAMKADNADVDKDKAWSVKIGADAVVGGLIIGREHAVNN